jgi:predicted phage-related endonuclease
MQTAVECARKLEDLMKTVDTITEMYDEVKGRIYETMLANNVDTIDREGLTITLKRPFTRSSIDSKKLAKDLPDVYDKYIKTTEVKGNVTIKLK